MLVDKINMADRKYLLLIIIFIIKSSNGKYLGVNCMENIPNNKKETCEKISVLEVFEGCFTPKKLTNDFCHLDIYSKDVFYEFPCRFKYK